VGDHDQWLWVRRRRRERHHGRVEPRNRERHRSAWWRPLRHLCRCERRVSRVDPRWRGCRVSRVDPRWRGCRVSRVDPRWRGCRVSRVDPRWRGCRVSRCRRCRGRVGALRGGRQCRIDTPLSRRIRSGNATGRRGCRLRSGRRCGLCAAEKREAREPGGGSLRGDDRSRSSPARWAQVAAVGAEVHRGSSTTNRAPPG
jgi:hypothetical protein